MLGRLRVHRVMQGQLRHLGERDILADHILIDHAAIELFQRVATRGNARRDQAPRPRHRRSLPEADDRPRGGGKPLDQLVTPLARRLDADRVRQADIADGF